MPKAWIPATPRSAKDRAAMPCCPRCQCDLLRVARRALDRLWSWVAPVRRYRCLSFRCQWEGNIRVDKPPGQVGDGVSPGSVDASTENAPGRDRVPASFVLAMTLAAAGTVFVVVFAATDWLAPDAMPDDKQAGDGWLLPARHAPPASMAVSRR